jgi:beta-lactam-binding protein with PASTA domain
MTTVPNVVDVSLRQALTMIENKGLEVGQLTFSPDMAHGIVLNQFYKGRSIVAGTRLPVDSKIDLEIGKSNDYVISVPLLTGLQLPAAKNLIIESMLNLGKVVYDESIQTITDSINAIVYAQYPSDKDDEVPVGTQVDIVLYKEPQK